MLISLRSLRLLTLVTWLGGLIFFAAVLAPVAFSPGVIERTHSLAVSGEIVGMALRRLHWTGLFCGGILLLLTGVLRLLGEMRGRLVRMEVLMLGAMLALTAYSQFSIIPRMDVDRSAAGEIDQAPRGSGYREDFDRLHRQSVQVESGVLMAGLVFLVLLAAEGRRSFVEPPPR